MLPGYRPGSTADGIRRISIHLRPNAKISITPDAVGFHRATAVSPDWRAAAIDRLRRWCCNVRTAARRLRSSELSRRETPAVRYANYYGYDASRLAATDQHP